MTERATQSVVERWVIRCCPECGGQVTMHGGLARHTWHRADCSHIRTGLATSAVREVEVIPLAENERLREALRAIRGPEDQGPWIMVYRDAGGGYDGLQAIARAALDEGDP